MVTKKTASKFKELGRVQTSDSIQVVVSEVYGDDKKLAGFSINKYIESERYTGFTKGVYVPADMLPDFLRIFGEEDLKFALEVR